MEQRRKQYTHSIRHSDVCAFAERLRKALNEGEDAEVLRRQVVAFWREHMEDYLSQEQELLLPRLRGLRANMLSWNLQKEQRQIAHLMWYLWYPRPNTRAVLFQLADVLANHIRFKEHELLPFLRQHLEEPTFARTVKPLYEHLSLSA